MKIGKKKNFFLVFLCAAVLLAGSCSKDPAKLQEKEQKRLLQIKQKEQKKLKSKVNVTLRAAHTAYNAKRYALAEEKFEIAVNKGWLDGIDLYQYADCLEKNGQAGKSKEYFALAYTELQTFYPNHSYIQTSNKTAAAETLAPEDSSDFIAKVKQGHFESAPKISIEALAAKYRYSDPASIKWELILDENKNEYVRAILPFQDHAMVAAQVEKQASEGEIEYMGLWVLLDTFLYEAVLSRESELISDRITKLDIRTRHYTPESLDPEDHETPPFFILHGGELILDFLAEEDRMQDPFKISKANILFTLESPDEKGDTIGYAFRVPVDTEFITGVLVSNRDLNMQTKNLIGG